MRTLVAAVGIGAVAFTAVATPAHAQYPYGPYYPRYVPPVYVPRPVYVPPPVYVPRPVYVPPPVYTPTPPAQSDLPALDPVRHPAPIVLDPTTPDRGMSVPGSIRINPGACAMRPAACVFVTYHEQGHKEVGSDEHAADCWAARNAPTYAVEAAISEFAQNPLAGDASHGTGSQRIGIIRQCYAERQMAAQQGADHSSSPSTDADECKQKARSDYRACRQQCREDNEDVGDRVSCYGECRATQKSDLLACEE